MFINLGVKTKYSDRNIKEKSLGFLKKKDPESVKVKSKLNWNFLLKMYF